jgi:shikimate kinase
MDSQHNHSSSINSRSLVLPIVDRKAFLDKQHFERDSLFEEVATLAIESTSIEENVNKIIKALEE